MDTVDIIDIYCIYYRYYSYAPGAAGAGVCPQPLAVGGPGVGVAEPVGHGSYYCTVLYCTVLYCGRTCGAPALAVPPPHSR